jgi:hypothetical protein
MVERKLEGKRDGMWSVNGGMNLGNEVNLLWCAGTEQVTHGIGSIACMDACKRMHTHRTAWGFDYDHVFYPLPRQSLAFRCVVLQNKNEARARPFDSPLSGSTTFAGSHSFFLSFFLSFSFVTAVCRN